MIKTREDVSELDAEICPVCDDTRVQVVEVKWFVLELDRDDELRGEEHRSAKHGGQRHAGSRPIDDELYEDEPGLEFRCLSCGANWV
ncbi:hypothetical protein [Microbacterium sp.]|jgi:hypothetical protein|uniref:hypothetical protein n=1 Tax=Microbacterium sp. TaxID=51671 RepID=UPI0037C9B7B2